MAKLTSAMQSRVKHIHFIGIGGVGMGGIAEVLLKLYKLFVNYVDIFQPQKKSKQELTMI